MTRTAPPVLLLAFSFLLLTSCQKSNKHYKVLIGATTVAENGARPIPDSVIVIAGTKIDSFGERKNVPIPEKADRTELAGRWIVPAPGNRIDVDHDANLLILDHAPAGAVAANPKDIGAQLVLGEWQVAKQAK
jgi:hypothetical protein